MLTNLNFVQQPHAATSRKENCFRKLENLENCRKTVANDTKEAAELCKDAELAEYMVAALVDTALAQEKCKYMHLSKSFIRLKSYTDIFGIKRVKNVKKRPD